MGVRLFFECCPYHLLFEGARGFQVWGMKSDAYQHFLETKGHCTISFDLSCLYTWEKKKRWAHQAYPCVQMCIPS